MGMARVHLLMRGTFVSFRFCVDRVLAPCLQQKHMALIVMSSITSKTAPIPAITNPAMFCSDRDIPKQEEEEEELELQP